MNITPIHEDDIVKVDIKGLVFFARVEEKGKGALQVRHLCRPIVRNVTSRSVIAHYRKSKASK